MILFNNKGGLGNSLFIYAFARLQAIHSGRNTALTDLHNLNPFRLRPLETVRYQAQRLYRKLMIRRFDVIDLDDCRRLHPFDPFKNYPKHSFINGYFQSPLYFKGHETVVKQWFQFKPAVSDAFRNKYPELNRESYGVVHVRRKDYASAFDTSLGGPNLILPVNYYKEALQALRQEHTSLPLYVISDEPEAAFDALKTLEPGIRLFKGNQVEDLQLLQGASAIVMANSTFSWWGAYLNTQQARIYCPRYFLGFRVQEEFPIHIYPEAWQQIAF